MPIARRRSIWKEWLNFLTSDIVGDLAFGAPFGCLEGSEYHPWVATIFHSIKTGASCALYQFTPFYPHKFAKSCQSG